MHESHAEKSFEMVKILRKMKPHRREEAMHSAAAGHEGFIVELEVFNRFPKGRGAHQEYALSQLCG